MERTEPTAYWDYLHIDELLSLQSGLAADEGEIEGDEVLFITVHQVFELWFKLVIQELRAARDLFHRENVAEQELSGAVSSLQRIITIFRVAAHHFEVVETLSTREYLKFRNKLMPASGFQSAQMRQMEALMGLEEHERIPLGKPGTHMRALENADGTPSPSMERVLSEIADRPNLKQAIEEWLLRTPIDGCAHDAVDAEAHLDSFVANYLAAHGREVDDAQLHAEALSLSEEKERIDAMYAKERASVEGFLNPSAENGGRRTARLRAAMLFIETYRDLPLLSWPRKILSSLIELEQVFLVFRQRHARMVERVIGRRVGTGGSAGVDYLDKTALEYRIFGDLWAIRTILVKSGAEPDLEHADYYGFVADKRESWKGCEVFALHSRGLHKGALA